MPERQFQLRKSSGPTTYVSARTMDKKHKSKTRTVYGMTPDEVMRVIDRALEAEQVSRVTKSLATA